MSILTHSLKGLRFSSVTETYNSQQLFYANYGNSFALIPVTVGEEKKDSKTSAEAKAIKPIDSATHALLNLKERLGKDYAALSLGTSTERVANNLATITTTFTLNSTKLADVVINFEIEKTSGIIINPVLRITFQNEGLRLAVNSALKSPQITNSRYRQTISTSDIESKHNAWLYGDLNSKLASALDCKAHQWTSGLHDAKAPATVDNFGNIFSRADIEFCDAKVGITTIIPQTTLEEKELKSSILKILGDFWPRNFTMQNFLTIFFDQSFVYGVQGIDTGVLISSYNLAPKWEIAKIKIVRNNDDTATIEAMGCLTQVKDRVKDKILWQSQPNGTPVASSLLTYQVSTDSQHRPKFKLVSIQEVLHNPEADCVWGRHVNSANQSQFATKFAQLENFPQIASFKKLIAAQKGTEAQLFLENYLDGFYRSLCFPKLCTEKFIEMSIKAYFSEENMAALQRSLEQLEKKLAKEKTKEAESPKSAPPSSGT